MELEETCYNAGQQADGPAYRKAAVDISRLDSSRYTLLRKSNDISREYLASLVDKGELKVTRNSRWKNKKGTRGPRGGHIIQKLEKEIGNIFRDLGLDRPECVNRGNSLRIPYGTRELLGSIREGVYRKQERGLNT